jgi:UDP-glucose 4-epimerase
LAGGSSVQASFAEPFQDFERSVSTLACALEFIRVASPRTKLVYPSSASVYGNTARIPIPECCPVAPISPYGLYKSLSEQVVAMYAKHYGVSASVIRFFSLYGCGLRKQLLWDACNKMTTGEESFMGTGRELRDWLHVDDAVSLIKFAVEHASADCPVVNGGVGVGVSVREILGAIAAHFPGSAAPKFLGAQRLGDPTAFVADIALSRAWGWAPKRPLTEGISEYVTWWKCARSSDRTMSVQSHPNVEVLRMSSTGIS